MKWASTGNAVYVLVSMGLMLVGSILVWIGFTRVGFVLIALGAVMLSGFF
jgi:hypothetical protein